MMDTLADIGGLILGFLLTIFVLSYVVKDNPLYRLAVHMLVGVSAGYAVVVVVTEVIAPIIEAIFLGDDAAVGIFWIIPLLLALFLLLKIVPKTAWLGNSSMAVLIGIGASVGLVGAVAGTLVPQVLVQYDNGWLAVIIALLTIFTLAYFLFTGRVMKDGSVAMPRWYPAITVVGRVVIVMTLAAFYAALVNTSLIILIDRVGFYMVEFGRVFSSILP